MACKQEEAAGLVAVAVVEVKEEVAEARRRRAEPEAGPERHGAPAWASRWTHSRRESRRWHGAHRRGTV